MIFYAAKLLLRKYLKKSGKLKYHALNMNYKFDWLKRKKYNEVLSDENNWVI